MFCYPEFVSVQFVMKFLFAIIAVVRAAQPTRTIEAEDWGQFWTVPKDEKGPVEV